MPSFNCQNEQRGFSLIECVIAISILAMLMGGMMSIQTSILRIVQTSLNKKRADLVLISGLAQVQYALDAYGQINFPVGTTKLNEIPEGNQKFTATVENIEVKELKLSSFLDSAVRVFYAGIEGDPPPELLTLLPVIDPLLPYSKKNFINIQTKVTWPQGRSTLDVSETLFMINTQNMAVGGN